MLAHVSKQLNETRPGQREWEAGSVPQPQITAFLLPNPLTEEKYVTVQPYASQSKDEIGFEKGVTVEVIRKNLEGWWYIR